MTEFYSEDTILRVDEFRINALLTDTAYIDSPNRYGELMFKFTAATSADELTLERRMEEAVQYCQMHVGPYSNKTPKSAWKDSNGHYVVEQDRSFFLPNFQHPDELMYRTVELKLWLKDMPLGDIILNCGAVNSLGSQPRIFEAAPADW